LGEGIGATGGVKLGVYQKRQTGEKQNDIMPICWLLAKNAAKVLKFVGRFSASASAFSWP